MIRLEKFAFKVVFIFLLSSCIDDNAEFTSRNLQGTWEQSQFNPEAQLFNVNALIFKEDGTFENRGSFRQQDVQVDLGYYYLSTGNYSLNGNKLIFSNLSYFILAPDSDQPYVLIEELIPLIPEEGNETNSLQVEISTDSSKTELTLDYGPCAPNELCLGPQTFFKVK